MTKRIIKFYPYGTRQQQSIQLQSTRGFEAPDYEYSDYAATICDYYVTFRRVLERDRGSGGFGGKTIGWRYRFQSFARDPNAPRVPKYAPAPSEWRAGFPRLIDAVKTAHRTLTRLNGGK